MSKFTRVEIQDGIRNIWFWRQGADSFHCRLFSLIAKADKLNRGRLEMGYPLHVAVYNIWDKAKSECELFREYGLESVKELQKSKRGI